MRGLERIFNYYIKIIMNKSKKWIDINIQPQIKLERFYEIMKEYFKSSKSKKTIKKINKGLEDIIKEEKKYLV